MNIFNLKSTYYFGKDALSGIATELRNHEFKKPMILYGGGSIKGNGIHFSLVDLLVENGYDNFVEYGGIEPNPRDTTIMNASIFARNEKVDVILAVGGGSVIDAAKVIGILSQNPQYIEAWDYVIDNSKIINDSIPIISVITLAGTASENNSGSVITNEKTKEKKGVMTPSANPIVTIENPEFTFSVNRYQTACGIFDCFSHLLEQYFGVKTFSWTKEYIYANLKILLKYAKIALKEPNNYEARSNILWTSSMALNGLASFRTEGDWSVHIIEHAFSGLWDIAHGAGLALVTPYYLFVRSKKEEWFAEKIIELGKEIFNVDTIQATINAIAGFIISIGLPVKWTQFSEIKQFTDEDFKFLTSHAIKFGSDSMKDIYISTISLIKNKY